MSLVGFFSSLAAWPLRVGHDAFVLSAQSWTVVALMGSIILNPKFIQFAITVFLLWFLGAFLTRNHATVFSEMDSAYVCVAQPKIDIFEQIIQNLALIYDKLICFFNLIVSFFHTLIVQGFLLLFDCRTTGGHNFIEALALGLNDFILELIQTVALWLADDPFHKQLNTFTLWDKALIQTEVVLNATTCLCEDLNPIVIILYPTLRSADVRCALNGTVNVYVMIGQLFVATTQTIITGFQRPNFAPIHAEICRTFDCIGAFLDSFVLNLLQLFIDPAKLSEIRISCVISRLGCIYYKAVNLILDVVFHIDIIAFELFTLPGSIFNPNSYVWRGAPTGLDITGLFDLIDNGVAGSVPGCPNQIDNSNIGLARCLNNVISLLNSNFGNAVELFIQFYISIYRNIYREIREPFFLFSGSFFCAQIFIIIDFAIEIGILVGDLFAPLTTLHSICPPTADFIPQTCPDAIGNLAQNAIDILIVPLLLLDQLFFLIGSFVGLGNPTYQFVDAQRFPELCRAGPEAVIALGACVHYVGILTSIPNPNDPLINSFGNDLVGIVLDGIIIISVRVRALAVSIQNVFFSCIPCFHLQDLLVPIILLIDYIFHPSSQGARFFARTLRIVVQLIITLISFFTGINIDGCDSGCQTIKLFQLISFWLSDFFSFLVGLILQLLDLVLFGWFTTLTGVRFTICMRFIGRCACTLLNLSIICQPFCTIYNAPPLTAGTNCITQPTNPLVKRDEPSNDLNEITAFMKNVTPPNTFCGEVFAAFSIMLNSSTELISDGDRQEFLDCVSKYSKGIEMNKKYPYIPKTFYLEHEGSVASNGDDDKDGITKQILKSFMTTTFWVGQATAVKYLFPESFNSSLFVADSLELAHFQNNITDPTVLGFSNHIMNQMQGFENKTWNRLSELKFDQAGANAEDLVRYNLKTVQIGASAMVGAGMVLYNSDLLGSFNRSYQMLYEYFHEPPPPPSNNSSNNNDTYGLMKFSGAPFPRSMLQNNPLLPFTWDGWRLGASPSGDEPRLFGQPIKLSNQWIDLSTKMGLLNAKLQYYSNVAIHKMNYETMGAIPGFRCELLDRVFEIVVNRSHRCIDIVLSNITKAIVDTDPEDEPEQLRRRATITLQHQQLSSVTVHNYTKGFDLTTVVFDAWDVVLDRVGTFFGFGLSNTNNITNGFVSFFTDTNTDIDAPTHGLAFIITWPFRCRHPQNLDCSRGLGFMKGYGITILIFAVIIPLVGMFVPLVDPVFRLVFGAFGILFFFLVANALAFYYSPLCFPALPECLGREAVAFVDHFNASCLEFFPTEMVVFPSDGHCLACGEKRTFVDCARDRGFFDGIDAAIFLLEWQVPSINDALRNPSSLTPTLILDFFSTNIQNMIQRVVNMTTNFDIIQKPLAHFNYVNGTVPKVDKLCFKTIAWFNIAPLVGAAVVIVPPAIASIALVFFFIILIVGVVVSTISVLLSLLDYVIALFSQINRDDQMEDQMNMMMAMSYQQQQQQQ